MRLFLQKNAAFLSLALGALFVTPSTGTSGVVVESIQRDLPFDENGKLSARGQTIIDHVNVMEEGHLIEVVLEASREKFLDILFQTLQA